MNTPNSTNNLSSLPLNPVLEIDNLHLTDLLRAALLPLKGVCGIYCIICTVTGAMYIGSAVDLSKRLSEHLFYSGKSNDHLQKALSLYGLGSFKIQILEFCEIGVLEDREQFYLNWLFSQPAELRYNFCPEVSTRLGTKHTEGAKQKISAALTGRTLSEETKLKMSVSHKENPHPFTGKVALNAMKISIYSLDNILVEEFSSQLLAASYLGTTPKTLRRYINNSIPFNNKYFIKN
jgi:group I intron endonuclease